MRRRPGQRPNRIGANPVAVKSCELRGGRPGRLDNQPEQPRLPLPVGPERTAVGGFVVTPDPRPPIYGAGLA